MDTSVDEFHTAIASRDYKIVKAFINLSNQQPYDNKKYILVPLLTNNWSLHDFIKLGNPNLTTLFLDSNDSVNINSHDDTGWTALHRATSDHDLDHVKLLLDRNADPNQLDVKSKTALYYLYQDRYLNCSKNLNNDNTLKILTMLIDRGAKATTTNEDGTNHLQIQYILEQGNAEVIECILKLDIDLRARYDEGNTAVHYLATNQHPTALKKLRGRDFDVNARNNHQLTPLWYAIGFGAAGAIKFLLNERADVRAAAGNNCSSLCIAAITYRDVENFTHLISLFRDHDETTLNGYCLKTAVKAFEASPEFEDQNLTFGKFLLEYLALQEANGMEIDDICRRRIKMIDLPTKHYDLCKRQLTTEVYESETLLQLLCCNEEKLVPCMRNEKFVQRLDEFCDALERTPVCYGSRLRKRLEKAKQTAALRESAASVVGELMSLHYPLLLDTIISYLKEEDLKVLSSISL